MAFLTSRATAEPAGGPFDDVVIGGGHNGLVAACYLALAGRRVCVLEARENLGGAALSAKIFPGVDANVSKYSYLVSLFPAHIRRELGICLQTIRRRISSYTPDPVNPERGIRIPVNDPEALAKEIRQFTGSSHDFDAWRTFYDRVARLASRVFPTLTQPLPSRTQLRERVNDDESWKDFFERPLGEVLERTFTDDTIRGIVMTDALIGTYSSAHDRSLNQNKCFLYHVIGNGSGDWEVPVGGMGALTSALAARASDLGVEFRTNARVTAVESSGRWARTTYLDRDGEQTIDSRVVLANCAPTVLMNLLGIDSVAEIPPPSAGAQVKVNLLLKRLPKLKDRDIEPADAFCGTLHINESYSQLEQAYSATQAGRLPRPLPLEIYCHSLTDPSILGPDLVAAGAQTLTVFALQTPHALFAKNNQDMKIEALSHVFESLNSVLAEPIEQCLWSDPHGNPCMEINTTADIEQSLNIPTGNIFHTPLDWPFADHPDEAGTWGVKTDIENIVICGSGARRGGGVSGIPGHNAAHHVLQFLP
jgi:phytoene dehydrogenase-like protein